MRITRNLFVLATALLIFSVSAAVAGTTGRKDKGASNNGPGPNDGADSVSFATCASSTNTENCQAFASSSEIVNGFSVIQFAVNSLGGAGNEQVLDVFTVSNSITPGDQLTLNLNNINNAYGVFACENGAGGPVDTFGNSLNGPCTVGNYMDLGSLLTEIDSGNTATFDFNAGAGSSWTFYTADGNFVSYSVGAGTGGGGTTTPEPGSASLLFAGALAAGLVALRARR